MGAFVSEKNFSVIKMHGTTINISISMGQRFLASSEMEIHPLKMTQQSYTCCWLRNMFG
jgi:hypothetical protein